MQINGMSYKTAGNETKIIMAYRLHMTDVHDCTCVAHVAIHVHTSMRIVGKHNS